MGDGAPEEGDDGGVGVVGIMVLLVASGGNVEGNILVNLGERRKLEGKCHSGIFLRKVPRKKVERESKREREREGESKRERERESKREEKSGVKDP